MSVATISVPAAFLRDPSLAASAKVLWLTLQTGAAGPGRLGAVTGLSHVTVRNGLAQLAAAGWYSPHAGALLPAGAGEGQGQVVLPVGLVRDQRVRPHGKLLYGLLQTLPIGEFTHSALASQTGISAVTCRRAVQELSESGWLQVDQANRKATIMFTLADPEGARRLQEVADAAKRIERATKAGNRNEAIMKEFLSLLIDSDDFIDNARPAYLVNPVTRERLELDRYYPPAVGFEYNGPQHYHTTKRFPSKQELAGQQSRDLIKEALCTRRGITLVVVTRRDLTLKGMQRKVGTLLPLRDLRGYGDLIEYLEQLSK